jgi:hypothetical protein
VEMVNLGLNKYKVYFKSLKNEDKNTVVPWIMDWSKNTVYEATRKPHWWIFKKKLSP